MAKKIMPDDGARDLAAKFFFAAKKQSPRQKFSRQKNRAFAAKNNVFAGNNKDNIEVTLNIMS